MGLVLYPLADPLLYSLWRPIQEVRRRMVAHGSGGTCACQHMCTGMCPALLLLLCVCLCACVHVQAA